MVWRLFGIGFVIAQCFGVDAAAQSLGPWHPAQSWYAPGHEACTNNSGGECLSLHCAHAGLTTLEVRLEREITESIGITVDGRPLVTLPAVQGRALITDPQQHPGLLEALSAGHRATFSTGQTVSLSGSARAIRETLETCAAQQRAFATGMETFAAEFDRFSNESTTSWPPDGQDIEWDRYRNQGSLVADLRGPDTDPFMRGLTAPQCEEICRQTRHCYSYTHLRERNSCYLRSSRGTLRGRNGAISGIPIGRWHALLTPVAAGGGTVVDPTMSWRPDDTLTSWTERRRHGAQRLGLACGVTQSIGQTFADGLRLRLPWQNIVSVGDTLELTWQGADLDTRIPIWLMVSTSGPVRFHGSGYYALGPEAPNPFGMTTGAGRHRALVAFHARGAGPSGSIRIEPLQEGALVLDVQVVAYQRSCRRESVHSASRVSVAVQPGEARLVLNNLLGRQTYTHELDLPEHGRRILFNENRLLVLDRASGAEVFERGGQYLSLSPTHRFVVAQRDGAFDVVDILDGHVAGQLRGELIYWGIGDSFALSSSTPWGKVDLISTFGDSFQLPRTLTGPSCCNISERTTHIGIDLENAAVTIWGGSGYYVGALQNPNYNVREDAHGGYSSSGAGSLALYHHALNSLGTVAPVSLSMGFDVVGGLTQTWEYRENFIPFTEDRIPQPFAERLSATFGRVGLVPTPLDQGPVARDPRTAFHLSRLGLALMDMTEAEVRLASSPEVPEHLTRDPATGAFVPSFRSGSLAAMPFVEPMAEEARQHGWRFTWSDESPAAMMSECYHSDLNQNEASATQLMLVRDVDRLILPGHRRRSALGQSGLVHCRRHLWLAAANHGALHSRFRRAGSAGQ
ncbi:PAN/Apple domain-containing protein [Pararhodobacter zhoushanensis]|uniref:PAN/Apple domain-containing protein n=1 Tax=Pararhodobacter zhoushanensis TaxID=2479545 RepID=A0ABT3H3X2_9RHOB|nr:PAN/Apple domain-containing protein [Pararhodobacter zhoushanensis]MCW1934512.1 PAN/Apple domain-containing protein [Pararhodobacter zhoushanensis]